MWKLFLKAALVASIAGWATDSGAMDPYAGNDPYWILLHEAEVLQELKLTGEQRTRFQNLIDELDLQFFPLRNKSADVARSGLTEITTKAQAALGKLLQPAQQKRLREIFWQKLGTKMLLRNEVADRLDFEDDQKQKLREILEATQLAVNLLQSEFADGKSQEALNKRFVELKTDEQKQILKLLSPEQQATWKTLLGQPFALSKLGHPAMKAPELVYSGEWINSSPLRLEELRGKVIVVHFYACGCGNCINNYPWYRAWDEQFRDHGLVVIGIHTPETSAERDSEHVRAKAAENNLKFPILIDSKSDNWNAWGNSMWPSVYLLDKRGYLRSFWPGELKWKGNDGEQLMRQQIEALLAEPAITQAN